MKNVTKYSNYIIYMHETTSLKAVSVKGADLSNFHL